jgi:hypothetical protein
MIALHKNAATTPAVRRKIAQSDEPVALLATRYSVSETLSENGKSGIVLKTARIRRIGCRQHSRQPRKSSSSNCAECCCCLWMTCWR